MLKLQSREAEAAARVTADMGDTGFPRADDNDFLHARRHQVLATLAHRLRHQPPDRDRLLTPTKLSARLAGVASGTSACRRYG